MKTKVFLFSLLLGFLCFSCEEDLDSIGMGIQPEEDKINIYEGIIDIDATTIKLDSIYAKTINGYLGNFTDPQYGDIKAGYVCQFYPSFLFSDSIIGTEIDSVQLRIFYNSYIGDSITPMQVTVYPVVKPLEEHYYTNVNPAEMCDLNNPIVQKTYTARDMTIPDSIHNTETYYKNILISMPKSVGQALFDEYINPNSNAYSSLNNFVDFFRGYYLESTFGTGNLIPVDYTELYVYYTRKFTTQSVVTETDSIYEGPDAAVFTVTKEVVQLNTFANTSETELLQYNPDKTYLKTPAGVFTEITIPIPTIIEEIGDKKFSSVRFSVPAYPQESWEYALDFPGLGTVNSSKMTKSKMLLIDRDSVTTFFEERRVADSHTSYTTTFNSSTYSYNFNNIANMIQNAIEKAPEKEMKLLLIPVEVEYYMQQSGYSYYETDYITSHYLTPSGVTLKKGGENLQLQIVASDLEINEKK